MPYATAQHLIARLGQREAIALSDRVGAGTPDEAALTQALTDASAEMDGYLGRRYALPLATRAGVALASMPTELRTACIDIARYRMTGTEIMETESIRTRFKDAITWLQHVAEGRVQINGGDLQLGAASNPARLAGGVAARTGEKTFGDLGAVL